jgi:hypothetical protein
VGHLKYSLRIGVLIGVLIGLISCEEQVKTNPEPTLQTEENKPIVENLPAEKKTAIKEHAPAEPIKPIVELDILPDSIADNGPCVACHLNFKNEPLTTVHAQANIGCTQCHGPSEAHRTDEDNITPPDVMFTKAQIKSSCSGCHTGDSMNIPAHKSVIPQADPLKAFCTDCHGEHHLNYRTRIWDKTTRNLIKDDRVLKLSDEIR